MRWAFLFLGLIQWAVAGFVDNDSAFRLLLGAIICILIAIFFILHERDEYEN